MALILFAALAHATTYTSSGVGNWNSASTWGGAGVPGAGDNVIINHAVTIPDGVVATVGTMAPATPCFYTGTTCTRPAVAIAGAGTTALSTETHYVYYTVVDAKGESGFSAESPGFAVTNGSTPPRVTFPAVPAAGQTYNLYSGTSPGTEKLYATGITTATYDMLIAEPAVTAHPGLGNSAIRINSPGSLTLGSGGWAAALIVRGDIGLNNGTLTISGGGTLMFDTTASGITTKPYVVWTGTANNQVNAKVTTANTSSSLWATITSQAGGGERAFRRGAGSL